MAALGYGVVPASSCTTWVFTGNSGAPANEQGPRCGALNAGMTRQLVASALKRALGGIKRSIAKCQIDVTLLATTNH